MTAPGPSAAPRDAPADRQRLIRRIQWIALPALGVLAALAADLLRAAVAQNPSIDVWHAAEGWLPTIVPAYAGYTVAPWPSRIWLWLLISLALALAALSTVALARMRGQAWWARAIALWISVVVAAVGVVGLAQMGEWLLQVQTFGGLGGSYVRTFTLPALQEAARWGLLWGWIPALITALSGSTTPARATGRRALLVGIVLVLATVASGACLASATHGAALSARTEVAAPDPPTPTQPVVPTDPPPAVAETAAPDFPERCAADDVEVAIAGFDAATGSRFLTFEARNTSASTCDLQGAPDLAFASEQGNAIRPEIVARDRTTAGDPVTSEPVTLAPGGTVRADLVWRAPTGRPAELTVLLAPWPGAERIAVSEVLDVVDGTDMALTPWYLAD